MIYLIITLYILAATSTSIIAISLVSKKDEKDKKLNEKDN